jgi:preprotein translocase subunit SecD
VAPPPGTLRIGRYFAALIVLLGLLYLVVGFPGARHTPKLGIDLVGGKRVIFTARTGNGTTPTSSSMGQARQIIEDRINGTGVTGATVQVQGGNQLVVLIPGGTATDVAALGQPAVLNFRGVVAPAQIVTCSSTAGSGTGASGTPSSRASSTATPTAPKTAAATSASANGFRSRPLATAPTPTTTPATGAATATTAPTSPKAGTSGSATSPAATGSAATTPAGSATATAPPTPCSSDPIAALVKTDPGLKNLLPNAEKCPSPSQSGTCHAFSSLSAARQAAITAALRNFDCAAAVSEPDEANRYYLACDTSSGTPVAYLLGHVVVKGSQVDSAAAQAPSTGTGGSSADWTVALNLKGSGGDRWNKWTSAYHTSSTNVSAVQTSATAPCGASGTADLPCSDFVAFTLNGEIVSAPVTNAVLDLQTSISGGFTQSSANKLAKQLNYGSLPLSFRTDANQDVSATLGTQQLHAAFLAGGIGLALVVLYSLLYYRGLGLVTIASLIVSAGLTYAMLVILGTQIGFTLDLAGIAGFIVALGITADSFVVFFERIKDEVHEGRSIRVAVPRAWVRARRTILSADTVSFLAAAILYYFAAADVKGFAFTLGMSTILDLVVVFLFTHPIVSLLSRSRTFGSPRFTGLNSVRTGGVIDDELPARRSGRAARAGSATRVTTPSEPTETATERAQRRRGVAVLDKPGTDDTDVPAAEASIEPVEIEPAEAEPVEVEPVEAEVADEGTDDITDATEPPARRRTTPQSGSAAERAAARRARLREQREKGES